MEPQDGPKSVQKPFRELSWARAPGLSVGCHGGTGGGAQTAAILLVSILVARYVSPFQSPTLIIAGALLLAFVPALAVDDSAVLAVFKMVEQPSPQLTEGLGEKEPALSRVTSSCGVDLAEFVRALTLDE